MKLKVLVLAFLFICLNTQAQNNNVKFENVVNEQFGTLLESLLTDGKIDEANAKTYLETVFGYDSNVTNFIQKLDLSKQLVNLKQGKLSNNDYLSLINKKLYELIPNDLQKSIGVDLSAYVLGQEIGTELASGKLGPTSLSFLKNILEENAKKKALIEKLELITPRLEKLIQKNGANETTKQVLSFDKFSKNEWNEISKTTVASFQRDINAWGGILNTVTLNEEYIELFNEVENKNGINIYSYYPIKTYKNKNRFDFSKDFQIDFWIELNQVEKFSGLGIVIGKGYQLNLIGSKNGVRVETPKEYSLTTTFSDIKPKWPYNFNSDKLSKKDIDFTTIKVTIKKIGTLFSCSINDNILHEITNKVSYFPDKYFLSFKQFGSGSVKIHKINLEHL